MTSTESPGDLYRRTPIQARSAARVEHLLDATAQLLDEIGYEQLSTQMVADRAGMSIGSVYKYFVNRWALVQALARRNLDRFVAQVGDIVATSSFEHYLETLDQAIDAFADLCRSEPGFRVIRFGDVIDKLLIAGTLSSNQVLAGSIVDLLVDQYGVEREDSLAFRLEVAIEISDKLMERAFLHDPEGDERFIKECKDVVRTYLASHLRGGRP